MEKYDVEAPETDFSIVIGEGLLVESTYAYEDWNAPERHATTGISIIDRDGEPYIYQPFEDLTLEINCPAVDLDLTAYFADDDADQLSYSIDYNTQDINLQLDGDALWINCQQDWSGQTEVTVIASDGVDSCSDTFLITVESTPTNDDDIPPSATNLLSNYPNPFNPTTTIIYSLNQDGPVEITIYDLRGRMVRKLVESMQPAGVHEVIWDGKDLSGKEASSGVYFYRMTSAGHSFVRKMIMMK